jgi:hypothetical protein
MSSAGSYSVIGRFNLASADIAEPDAKPWAWGLSLQILTPGGSEWRTGLFTVQFFPVSTPEAPYALLRHRRARKQAPCGTSRQRTRRSLDSARGLAAPPRPAAVPRSVRMRLMPLSSPIPRARTMWSAGQCGLR